MIVTSIGALPPTLQRAIIINCSTKMVTTLALMSALRHVNMPILLIDCESTDGSWAWFNALATRFSFDLLQLPLKPHGVTLDRIFNESRDERLLLIDSDLEILSSDVVVRIDEAIKTNSAYGAGFLHVGGDMAANGQTAIGVGRYIDRMWIPFTLLKVAEIKRVLSRGATFMHSRHYLEFPWHHGLSKLLYLRHRLPLLGKISLELFAAARQRIHGESFLFREYDTGALVHEMLTKDSSQFIDLGEPYFSQALRHYHGVTRATLVEGKANATAPNAIADEVATRLLKEYAITVG
jgi:glycosyltransferase involved in cell wall biosynthesis